MKTEKIDPSEIKIGDTVFDNGSLKTIGKENIKWYRSSRKQLEIVLYAKFFRGEIIRYQRQI